MSNDQGDQAAGSADKVGNTRERRKIVVYTGAEEIIKLHAPRSRWITRTVSFARSEMKRYSIATHCVITDLRSKEWVLDAHGSLWQRIKVILMAR